MKLAPLAWVGLLALNLGCASALKKKCEDTHWFDHGYQLAMNGKRVQGDDFLDQCRKAEAEIDEGQVSVGFKAGMEAYCKPDTALKIGKEGKPFNDDLCETALGRSLKAQHAKGVREFCTPENSQSAGASGYVYAQICPADLEKDFLPGYRRGRATYLDHLIRSREEEIRALDRQITDHERNRNISALRLGQTPRFDDPQNQTPQAKSAREERESLQREIRDLDKKIEKARAEQSALREQNAKMRAERDALKAAQ